LVLDGGQLLLHVLEVVVVLAADAHVLDVVGSGDELIELLLQLRENTVPVVEALATGLAVGPVTSVATLALVAERSSATRFAHTGSIIPMALKSE